MTDVQDTHRKVSQGFDAAITADPDEAAKEIDGPFGKMPAEQIIGQFVTMDVRSRGAARTNPKLIIAT